MDALKKIALVFPLLLFSGCQITYLVKSARSHFSILWARTPIEEALKDSRLTEDQKRKLLLIEESRKFGLHHLQLSQTANYTRFSYLDRPYVSYVVSAAPKWRLEHHEWSYPVVGRMPYKGYSNEEDAKAEQSDLQDQKLDTYLRGVSAYSTLGWFEDPVLSTMLSYSDQGLVNLILHETTHATLYIKNSADFNERLAVFVGNRGTEDFFLKKEGPDSPTVQKIKDFNSDDAIFSSFIGPEIKKLRQWYNSLPEHERTEGLRQKRFQEIQMAFAQTVLPQMKTKAYRDFPGMELNNARLLYFKTYMTDLSDFEKLYSLTGSSWSQFFTCVRTLEKSKKPEDELKILIKKITDSSIETACKG